MDDHQKSHPLIKSVPGHLLQFEEKIFGMTLTQLFSDLAAVFISLSLFSSLPLMPRIVVTLLVVMLVLTLVHGKHQGYTMLYFLYLMGRSRFLPSHSVWRGRGDLQPSGEPPSVQDCWIQLDQLDHGIASTVTRRKRGEPDTTYWAIFKVESLQNVRYLAETEKIRIYGRFQAFLDGLNFPVKLISVVENVKPEQDQAFRVQREAIPALTELPQLQQLQIESLKHQRASLMQCTTKKHLVVVSASRDELARKSAEDSSSSALLRAIRLLFPRGECVISDIQVKNEVTTRISVLKKTFQQLDIQATLLSDTDFLQTYASCLAPGHALPSFETRMVGKAKKHFLKHIAGLHGSLSYQSRTSDEKHLEAEQIRLADLLAPSAVTLHKDAVEVTVREKKRFQCYYEITGFAASLTCGWLEHLTELGLPMIISLIYQPIPSPTMIKILEGQLIKLESKKLADEKAVRIIRAHQKAEAQEIRSMIDGLAANAFTIFGVQMIIGIHASTSEILAERSHYLLSHLRDMQLRSREAVHRQDIGWQACLPTPHTALDAFINLPSEALSAFMNWSTGSIGTPTGAYIGTTGSGLTRRPIYFNPWDATRRLANPHVVICGESGMGKSWLAKILILALLCTGIADAVVLDRDGDYDESHRYLRNASQRFNLAGTCPINLLDIPYGPMDIDLDDPIDVMAEFIDNHLLIGLALLYGEALTRAQEAFLVHAARTAYAAKGITMEAIRRDPDTLLREPPVFADLIAVMRDVPASSESLRLALLERFENVSYLFPGQTTVSIDCPLTIFNINKLDEKYYPLMVYVIQTFLQRHRALRRDERYLAYVVEEASYMLKHPAGKRYLESGSRGFRKLGIAQFTLSQHPEDFLEEGKVVLSNAGTCFFLGMQRHAAQKLELPEELSHVLEAAVTGQAVMRCGREYAAIEVSKLSPLHRAICTTDPHERRLLQQKKQQTKAS